MVFTALYTCAYLGVLTTIGLVLLAFKMYLDPNYLVNGQVQATGQEKRQAAKDAVPYYWVSARDPDSVERELERIRRREVRLARKIKDSQMGRKT